METFKTFHLEAADELKGIDVEQTDIIDAFSFEEREAVPPRCALKDHTVEETKDLPSALSAMPRLWSCSDIRCNLNLNLSILMQSS